MTSPSMLVVVPESIAWNCDIQHATLISTITINLEKHFENFFLKKQGSRAPEKTESSVFCLCRIVEHSTKNSHKH